MKITLSSPALAAYAAVAAPWFPIDDTVTTFALNSRAIEMAEEARRSLYDHVGFLASSLMYGFR